MYLLRVSACVSVCVNQTAGIGVVFYPKADQRLPSTPVARMTLKLFSVSFVRLEMWGFYDWGRSVCFISQRKR